jgi:hypothetical protein
MWAGVYRTPTAKRRWVRVPDIIYIRCVKTIQVRIEGVPQLVNICPSIFFSQETVMHYEE